MINAQYPGTTGAGAPTRPVLGTIGRLAIFFWSLALVLLAPAERMLLAAGIGLLINTALYPSALKRLFRWRWLLFACLLILPSIFLVGERNLDVLGISISSTGLQVGINMVLRALVVIVAVDGFSSAVDISEVAGILERAGLPGLGFSMGVAVNLLPALRHSSECAWRSLRMRGGFRRQWWRGLRLLLVTIMANALRRSEEIALAAETRAFSPSRSRPLPVKIGRSDWLITAILLASLIALIVLR